METFLGGEGVAARRKCTQKKPLQLLWSSGSCWGAGVLRKQVQVERVSQLRVPIAGTVVLHQFSVDLDL
jgi:hypothetical protein